MAHGVDEVVIADPVDHTVTLLGRDGDGYAQVERSGLLGVAAADIAGRIEWPPTHDA